MALTCPNCGTRYRIDAEQVIPSGAHVRCAYCKTVWTAAEEATNSSKNPHTDEVGSAKPVEMLRKRAKTRRRPNTPVELSLSPSDALPKDRTGEHDAVSHRRLSLSDLKGRSHRRDKIDGKTFGRRGNPTPWITILAGIVLGAAVLLFFLIAAPN